MRRRGTYHDSWALELNSQKDGVATTELQKVVGGAVIGEDKEFLFAHGDSEVPISIQMEMLDKLVWS